LPKEFSRFQEELKIRDKQVHALKNAVEGNIAKNNEIIREYEEKLGQKAVYIQNLYNDFEYKNNEKSKYIEELKRDLIQKDLLISGLKTSLNSTKLENDDLNIKLTEFETFVSFI
jgi:hypothetical protein